MKKNLFKKNIKLMSEHVRHADLFVLKRVLLCNRFLEKHTRMLSIYQILVKLQKRGRFMRASTHFRTQCFLTWRTRSVYSFFRLTRMTIRERFSFGLLKGIRKSS